MLVERFYADAWNRWDDRVVDEILTADFVFRGSLGDHAQGRDGFRSYRDKVHAAFPDFRYEVLDLIAQGLDNAQIAARLELSEKTVRNNITHIFDKIGVETRSKAIVLARERGLGGARPQ